MPRKSGQRPGMPEPSPKNEGVDVSFRSTALRLLLAAEIAARALATYLIPGCVGRGVRLGSESSSGAGGGGGVWKSGNLEIWEFGDLGIWRPGDLEIQKF